MKLLEQYLHSVGNHLPLRGKKDILKELRTLLMDEIEEKFGTSPSEQELMGALKQFGSPREVARRYTGAAPIIAKNLEEAYVFILKVMAFGITIGYTVTLIISLLRNALSEIPPLTTILDFLYKTITAIISGTGSLTLIFIGLSRFPRISAKALDFEEWNPEELKGVELNNPIPSKLECLFTVLANGVLLFVANLMPDLISLVEGKAHYAGIIIQHTVDAGRFLAYVRIASILWIIEAIEYAYMYFKQKKSRAIIVSEIALKISTPLICFIMLLDTGLYLSYHGIIGMRLLFLIGTVGGTIALGKYAITEFRRKLENSES